MQQPRFFITPVSYTHLDVYKRQDPEISLRIYYAQAGEELFAIARRFHVSPAQMLAANDLAEGTTAIDAPQRLLVPGAGG